MTKNHTALPGIAIAIAGVLLATATVLMAVGQGKEGQVLFFAGYVLLGPGLVGLYVAQADRFGKIGHLGFHVAFLGLLASMPLAAVLTLGYLGVPEAVSLVRSGALLPFGTVGDYALLGGLATFAVATARAGVLPRRAAIVLGVGIAFLVAAQMMILVPVTWIAGNALNAVAFAWLGGATYARRDGRAGRPGPTLA